MHFGIYTYVYICCYICCTYVHKTVAVLVDLLCSGGSRDACRGIYVNDMFVQQQRYRIFCRNCAPSARKPCRYEDEDQSRLHNKITRIRQSVLPFVHPSPFFVPVPLCCLAGVFSPKTNNQQLKSRYCTSEQADKVLYPYCPKEYRAMDYRMQMVAREVRGHAADLIMLQVRSVVGGAIVVGGSGGDGGDGMILGMALFSLLPPLVLRSYVWRDG